MIRAMSSNGVFKQCPYCGYQWQTRDDFLNDPDITIIGYQPHFIDLRTGLFLFNHYNKATMAVKVSKFTDLYDGPIFSRRKTNSLECPGYCLYNNELRRCTAQCECAYIREVLQILRRWPKIVALAS